MTADERAIIVPVLTYHQVEPVGLRPIRRPGLVVSATSFRIQMLLLRALGYRSIRFAELADALTGARCLPRRAVLLSFDDGYAGVYATAFPILRRLGLTATLFLIAEDYAPVSAGTVRAFPVMTRAQVTEMLAAGFEVGSHSVTHAPLTELTAARAWDEIAVSKEILERAFGPAVIAWSYPYGSYERALDRPVAEAGYRCGCTTRFGRTHHADELLALKRIPVGAAQRLPDFLYRLLWERDAPSPETRGSA